MTDLFSIANSFSDIVHAKDEILKLDAEIARIKTTCGSCKKWMTDYCPNETRKNKVTCGDKICSKLEMDAFSKRLLYKKQIKAASLKTKLKELTAKK